MVTKLERENNTIFYLHNAWANSPDGTAGFTLEESADAAYIGNCISMSSAEVRNPSSYNWIAVEFEAVEESDTAELTELGEDVPEDPEDEDDDYSYEDYMDGAVQAAADTATTAQESADIAQQKAEEATASAALAQQKAEAAATSATEAKTAAAAATADATTAKAQAAEAKTAADAATKDAGTAKEKAEAATTAAATAQQKAESATAAAGTAQSAAQSATSDARAAGIAAATAQAAAEAAQGDIDEQKKYFYHDKLGAHVLDPAGGKFRTDVKSSGLYIVDASKEKATAYFGATNCKIGNDEGSSIHIDGSGIDIMAEGQPLAKFGLSNATKYAPVLYDVINKNLTDGKCTGLSTYKINKNYANEGELKTHVTVKLIYHENDDGVLDNNAIVPLDEYHPNSYTLGIAGDHINITFEENAFQTEVKHFRPSYEGDFSDVDIALTYPAAYGLGMATIGNRLNWPEYNDTGDFSLAIGTGNVADDYSMAIGVLSFAQAYSIACGNLCTAGANSCAFGYSNQAEQGNSFALGSFLHTDAPNQLVIGYKNKTTAEGITARFVVAGGSQDEENEEEPYNSAAITGDGDVRIKGDLYAHCNDDSGGGISFTKITSGTGTAKATTGSVSIKPKWWRCGNLVQMEFGVEATGAVNPGKNLATGTITGIPRPVTTYGLRAVSYYGDNANVLFVSQEGNFTVRNCGRDALAKGNNAIGIFTYITDGSILGSTTGAIPGGGA